MSAPHAAVAVHEDDRIVIGDRKEPIEPAVMRPLQAELEGFAGQPITEIARRWWAGREEAERREHEALEHATDQRPIHEFYATTDRYLYELSYWEAQRDKQREFRKLWRFCRDHGLRRLLDFGGGVGGLSVFLTPRGVACDYLDIPGRTFDFARFRFQRRGLAVQPWEDIARVPAATFDAIVAYDVFEHLFDLEGDCARLSRALRPGGWLISKPTFSGGGAHLEKNYRYADLRTFNAMLAERGLTYRGRIRPGWRSALANALGWRYAVHDVTISPAVKYGGNFLLHQRAPG